MSCDKADYNRHRFHWRIPQYHICCCVQCHILPSPAMYVLSLRRRPDAYYCPSHKPLQGLSNSGRSRGANLGSLWSWHNHLYSRIRAPGLSAAHWAHVPCPAQRKIPWENPRYQWCTCSILRWMQSWRGLLFWNRDVLLKALHNQWHKRLRIRSVRRCTAARRHAMSRE